MTVAAAGHDGDLTLHRCIRADNCARVFLGKLQHIAVSKDDAFQAFIHKALGLIHDLVHRNAPFLLLFQLI